MQGNPFAQFHEQQPVVGRRIEGPPRTPPPRYDDEATRAANAAAASGYDPAKAAEDLRNLQLRNRQLQTEVDAGPAATAKEGEKRASFLTTKLSAAMREIGRQSARNPRAQAPSFGAEAARIFGDTAANFVNSPERQAIEAAQFNAIDAALTLGTGAAYTKEQIEGYRRSLFPALGDDDTTIASKREQLRATLEAAKLNAGIFAPQIDEALKAAGYGDETPLTDEQVQAGIRERVARGDPASATIKWLVDIGRQPDDEQIAAIIANQGNRNPDVRPPEDPMGRRFKMGLGDIAEGAGDVLGLVANPLNFGINALTGANLSTDLGQTFRNATGFPSPQTDSENLASAINRGGVAGFGLANTARYVAPAAAAGVQSALARFGAVPMMDGATGATGSAGSEFARQQGVGPVGQVAAGIAAGGATIPLASRVGRMVNPPSPVQTALTRAGEAEGVTVNRAMVDPSVQNRVTGAEATLAGGPLIRRDMGAVSSQIEGRVKALGNGGEALSQNVAGQTVQRALERSIKTSGAQARRQYDRAERAAGGIKVTPARSLQVVDDTIAKLSETPEINAAEIGFLNKLRADFQSDLSVGGLRRVRTSLRKRISKGELTFGENEADVLSVMDAASEDIASGLAAAGKRGAAQMFRKADADYRDRMEFIKGTVQKVIGGRNNPLSPEKVFERFKSMASPKGDEAGLARVIRTMDEDEQADIAATFAEALGKNNKGEFSTAFLLSQAEKLPKAARVNVFGPKGAQSLENLLVLGKEHARVMGGLNHSRTGVANDYRSWLGNLVFGGSSGLGTAALTDSGGTGAAVGVGTALAGAAIKGARDVLNARTLMSPDIAKWLASAPRGGNATVINRHFDQLKTIATRQPAIAPEIGELQRMIMRAANENLEVRGVASDAREDDDEYR